MIEQLDKQYVLQTYARNYVNFKKGVMQHFSMISKTIILILLQVLELFQLDMEIKELQMLFIIK